MSRLAHRNWRRRTRMHPPRRLNGISGDVHLCAHALLLIIRSLYVPARDVRTRITTARTFVQGQRINPSAVSLARDVLPR